MKTRLHPALIGSFVLGAVVLVLVGLMLFGAAGFLGKPQRYMVYFDETVSGLEPGAPVKMRGVRAGRVVDINVRVDMVSRRSVVAVTIEVDRDVATDAYGTVLAITDRRVVEDLVARGLRAKLNFVGITGLLYVELDFEDPERYPADPQIGKARLAVIPSVPSSLSEFSESISVVVTGLAKVDFPGISAQLKQLLATLDSKVSAVDAPQVAKAIREAAEAVRGTFSNPALAEAVVDLGSSLREIRVVVSKIDAQVQPTAEELRRAVAGMSVAFDAVAKAAASIDRLAGPQGGLGTETVRTLQQVQEAADAMRRLADFIECNPNALLFGRPDQAPAP